MPGCSGTPISHLRLERLALGDLDGAAADSARAHLDGCAACREVFDRIGADRRQLRPLRLEAVRPRARSRAWLGAGGLVAAAAALLLVLSRGDGRVAGDRGGATARVAVKGGGELVIGLVRERDGVVDAEPRRFADGDRFKISVTCTRPGRVELEPTVSQGGLEHRPLGARLSIDCANNTLLPGAFAITGDDPVLVCVAEDPGGERACLELKSAAASD